MPNFDHILSFFDSYIKHYSELLSFENQKVRLLASDNTEKFGESISTEQALIMKGKSLETKRLELLEKEGLSGKRFEQIINEAPEEYKSALIKKRDELSKYIFEIKRINNHSMQTINEKLASLEKVIAGTAVDTYDGKGGKKHNSAGTSQLWKNV